MSASSDVEKLFAHFGGNASEYQEIGRENEAGTARTRWPLLVTLDLSQPEIPAVGAPRGAAPVSPKVSAASADAADDTDQADADAGIAQANGHGQHEEPITRGSRPPLFARAHRRVIPPVATPSDDNGYGAKRFAAIPPVASVASAISAATTAATTAATPNTEASVMPTLPPVTSVAPAAHVAPVTQAIPPAQPPAPVAYEPAPSFLRPAPAPAPYVAPAIAPAAPHAPAAQPSILGQLFTPPAPQPAPAAASSAPSAPLASIFARLRGKPAASADAQAGRAASRSWFNNGPRRS